MKRIVLFLTLSYALQLKAQDATVQLSSKSLEAVIRDYAKKYGLRRTEAIRVFYKQIKGNLFAYLDVEPFSEFFKYHVPSSYAVVDSYAVCFYNDFKVLTKPTLAHRKQFYLFMSQVTGRRDYAGLAKDVNARTHLGFADYPTWKLLITDTEASFFFSTEDAGIPPDEYFVIILQKYFPYTD